MSVECATAVNSANNLAANSVSQMKDLVGANSYETQLRASPKYQRYLQEYETLEKNALSREIGEALWPRLTSLTLMGPDKINLRTNTFFFIDNKYLETHPDFDELDDNNYSVTFFHLGEGLTGHQGIIHGGLLATLLDELTCRVAFQNFPLKKGVTANLNLNYRQPTHADHYVMIKCEVSKKQGRQCWVKGLVYKMGELDDDSSIETKENLLVECEILVIEPKWVKELKNKPN